LTSDNYDDSEKKVVGGRNGFGAKLANIFSTKFEVECCDGKQKYHQVFENNMQIKSAPKLTPKNLEKGYTKITFSPDLSKFKMRSLDKDTVKLLERRVYDIAGSTDAKVKVYLNEELLPVTCFKGFFSSRLRLRLRE